MKLKRQIAAFLAAPMLLSLAAVIERTNVIEEAQTRVWEFAGSPFSGTGGALAGQIASGDYLKDITNDILYVNEGSKASPYYTPVGYDQANLLAWRTDFRDGVGKPHANTDASTTLVGSGIRIHGQGIAEVDAGVVVTIAEGGALARLTITDEASHLLAIGTDGGVFQPDQHGGLLVVDTEFNVLTDIVNKTVAVGFIGLAANALDPPITNSNTVITLVQDDLALLFMDDDLTDAAGLFLAHNKADAAATVATSATGVDSGVDIAAVGTFARYRVELQRTTTVVKMVAFKDKVQIGSIADAFDEDEECSPVTYIGAGLNGSVEAIDVRRWAAWAVRA